MPAISLSKANHLFWLGRYAERLFAQLHFLRFYYDKCLDDDHVDVLQEYCRRLNLNTCPDDRELFLHQHIFDNTPGTLQYCLNCLNDNAIVLREDLTTASIGYINLCVATLSRCDENAVMGIDGLQPLTDYILAFWGSILQHVTDLRTLNMLFIGKHVEYLDMYSRFGYPFRRLQSEWMSLAHRLGHVESLVDCASRSRLEEIFADGEGYAQRVPETLCLLNTLVRV